MGVFNFPLKYIGFAGCLDFVAKAAKPCSILIVLCIYGF